MGGLRAEQATVNAGRETGLNPREAQKWFCQQPEGLEEHPEPQENHTLKKHTDSRWWDPQQRIQPAVPGLLKQSLCVVLNC